MNYFQRWKKTTIANQAQVIIGGLVALGTLFLAVAAVFQYLTAREQSKAAVEQLKSVREQTNIMRGQLESMNSSSQQTQDLIEATRGTANASQSVAEQNKELVKHSGEQAKAAADQAKASLAQAEAAKQSIGFAASSARAAEQSAQVAAQGTQPYIDVRVGLNSLNANQPILITVSLVNEGNSPAEVHYEDVVVFKDRLMIPTDFTKTNAVKPFTLSPRGFKTFRVLVDKVPTAEDIAALKQKKVWMYIYGRGWYIGLGGRRPIRFCNVYHGDLGMLVDCYQPERQPRDP